MPLTLLPANSSSPLTVRCLFFFNDTATTEIYTLSLHDALPISKVDRDGNDLAGIRLPVVQVPIGTYTGWNLQSPRLAEDELSGLLGSFIPFAKARAERSRLRDPRWSLKERYKSHSDYVKKISHAARLLVDQRYLLPDDAQRIIDEAKKRRVP